VEITRSQRWDWIIFRECHRAAVIGKEIVGSLRIYETNLCVTDAMYYAPLDVFSFEEWPPIRSIQQLDGLSNNLQFRAMSRPTGRYAHRGLQPEPCDENSCAVSPEYRGAD
jgi:hypothetical protein